MCKIPETLCRGNRHRASARSCVSASGSFFATPALRADPHPGGSGGCRKGPVLITRARAQSRARCPLPGPAASPQEHLTFESRCLHPELGIWSVCLLYRCWRNCLHLPRWAGCGPCLSVRTFFTPYMFPNQESCKCLLFSFANGNRQKPEGRGSDFGKTSLHPQRRWLSPDHVRVCRGTWTVRRSSNVALWTGHAASEIEANLKL